MNDALQKLTGVIKETGLLQSIEALLDWDQETQMPRGGVAARAEQTALVAGLVHDRLVSDRTRDLIESARTEPDDFVGETNLREFRRSVERASRIPSELVREIARTSSLAKDAWAEARRESDYARFAPLLRQLIDQKKEVARLIGYEAEPYDALMDEFEPGALSADIEAIFQSLRERTVPLLERILGSSHQPDASILHRDFPQEKQGALCRRLAEAVGFDFQCGRSDVSVHPFCTTIGGPHDVRITTRFLEDFLSSALFGTLHEAGHALYEQGLAGVHAFTPMGSAVSLGIHESQSRMWENFVGRSRVFWSHNYPHVQTLFPEALMNVPEEDFYAAINTVSPSMIRVEADELTYNLHIILRFELERALFNDELGVDDIPSAWNERMSKMLGITPKDDAEGCLQDIHWSMGAFGYFPTYALGNLYAAQFFEKAHADLPELDDHIADNNHQPLLDWLRENIHAHGQRFRAGELVERVTGKPLSIEPFMDYATTKFGEIYRLS